MALQKFFSYSKWLSLAKVTLASIHVFKGGSCFRSNKSVFLGIFLRKKKITVSELFVIFSCIFQINKKIFST